MTLAASTTSVIGRPFEPLVTEFDYAVTDIEGRLPPELTGTLYRIGPGKFVTGTSKLHSMFEGDGMISRFILDGSGVRFTNRYVRTKTYLADRRSWGPIRLANVANTNVVPLAGELLACWEFGNPHRIDPDTLETLGTKDFDGNLGYLGSFSAHPKWDPSTGEMFNFGVDIFPTPRLRCYRVEPGGRAQEINSVTLWDMAWNHDFALTEKYMVFVIDPFRPPSIAKLIQTRSLAETLDHHFGSSSSKFILVPRDGSKPRIIEHPAQLHIHMTNAYEDGTDTVVEFVRYENLDFIKRRLQGDGPDSEHLPRTTVKQWPASHLVQFRIAPSGRITERIASGSSAIEFPQYDWRRSTRKHNFTYTAATQMAEAPYYDGIAKHDLATGESTWCQFDGCSVGEPLFVPRTRDGAEDDGWLVAVKHDLVQHRSALVVLDARDVEGGPLATAHLSHHIPIGFHGTFQRRIARSSRAG